MPVWYGRRGYILTVNSIGKDSFSQEFFPYLWLHYDYVTP